jgi:hypothetical protein
MDVWLWLFSAAISVAVGLRFFGHYYLQLTPPLALLAAIALSRSSHRAVRATIAVAIVSGVMFSAAGYFLKPFGPEPEYQPVSRYLASHTSLDDRVLVWGNVPEIYWASGLRPASRFIATTSLVAEYHPGREEAVRPSDVDPRIWRWFFRDIKKHAPKYIVDTAPAQIRSADEVPMSNYPRLERYLQKNYQFDRTIDSIDLYVRN